MTLEEFEKLKDPEILDLIKSNEKKSPDSFVLKNRNNKKIPARAVAEQIYCRKKAAKKLPEISSSNFLFKPVSLEQCSGEAAAKYKASLLSGSTLFDMTGGLGIDDIYFSQKFDLVIYCEQDLVISSIMEFNINQLNISNIKIFCNNSVELLKNYPDMSLEWIYLDPARRDEKKRSIDLEFCSPNIFEIKNLLFTKTKNICIKISPGFDITEAVNRFKELKKIIVVSVNKECKEILLFLEKNYCKSPIVQATVLNLNKKNFFIEKTFSLATSNKNISEDVQQYIFEPDPAIIKAKLTASIADKFNLKFINETADYLTGKSGIENFPGRFFYVEHCSPFKPDKLKKYLKENSIKKANFAKRHFPLSVEELRKKIKVKEGGNDYFFFTKDKNEDLIYIHSIR